MPGETEILRSFIEIGEELMRHVWLKGLYDVAFEPKREWFINKIKRTQEYTKGLKFYIPFLTRLGWAWRPMGQHGYTPTGSTPDSTYQYAMLNCHASTIQLTHAMIMATRGNPDMIKDMIKLHMRSVSETFPYYQRQMYWTGTSGVLGVVSAVNTTTITFDNTGLGHTHLRDRVKLFVPDMYIQFYTSAGIPLGNPVRVVTVSRDTGKITIESAVADLADDCFCTVADIAGLESAYNQSSPGILDVIDDDNVFQGVDRSAAGGSKLRAVVHDNDGTPEAVTRNLLLEFFHDCYDPDWALAAWRLIDAYWENNCRDNIRYVDKRIFEDGFRGLVVGRTKLVESDDMDHDKVIVPDLENMKIADTGNFQPLADMGGGGWHRIQGRPFYEYVVTWWATMFGLDCRKMGKLLDLDYEL